MSGDPKEDLLRQSGPLGNASSVPAKVLHRATDVQAAIISQNDEIIRQQGVLQGAMEAGFVGVHGRIGHLEKRVAPLEDFRSKIMMIPKSVQWFIGAGGLGLLLDGIHAMAKMAGYTH